MTQPQLIVSAMRAGVREYIERPTTTTDLLEAFVRLTSTRRKPGRESSRGKVFTVVNAKGGSGATTVAVNLALALQSIHPQHGAGRSCAPRALRAASQSQAHLHRLRRHHAICIGWILLCSTASWRVTIAACRFWPDRHVPVAIEPSASDFARLFDMMVGHVSLHRGRRFLPARQRHSAGQQFVGKDSAHRPRRCRFPVERRKSSPVSGRERLPRSLCAGV